MGGEAQGDDRAFCGLRVADDHLAGDVGATTGWCISEVAVVDLFEKFADPVGAVWALGRVLGQELTDQPLQFHGGVRTQGAQRCGLLVEVLVDHVPGGAGEGSAAGDHLVEHAAERVQVGAVVEGAGECFGCHVGRGADRDTGLIITAEKDHAGGATGRVEWDRASFMAARASDDYPAALNDLFAIAAQTPGR